MHASKQTFSLAGMSGLLARSNTPRGTAGMPRGGCVSNAVFTMINGINAVQGILHIILAVMIDKRLVLLFCQCYCCPVSSRRHGVEQRRGLVITFCTVYKYSFITLLLTCDISNGCHQHVILHIPQFLPGFEVPAFPANPYPWLALGNH